MKRVNGRVAVVTGAGSGIGRATSIMLAERGCDVALVDRFEEGLAGTRDLLVRSGRAVSTHVVDVSVERQMRDLSTAVVDAHGGCHILVNNAGVTSAGRFQEESLEDLHWIVDINLWGVIHGCHFFLPILARQDEAHIVNLSSMVAFVGLPQNAAYSLTKGAVRSFTEALRGELVDSSVGATSVYPGAIRTAITAGARGAEAQRLARLGEAGPAARLLRPPEAVARKIVSAIEHDRARVVVGPDARALDTIARVVPGRSGLIGRAVNRLTAGSKR